MKLLYLHDTPIDNKRADSVQVLHMCSAFANLDIDLTLALPGTDAVSTSEEIEKQFGGKPQFKILTFRKTTVFGRLNMVGGYFATRKLHKFLKTDCCFVRNPAFLNVPLKHNIPTVFEAHASFIHKNPAWNALWMRNLLRNSRHPKLIKFIGISKALTDFWVKTGVPKEKVLALHDSVDAQAYSTVYNRKPMRRILGLPANRKMVVYAGSLYKDRGIESILDLTEIFEDVLFVVVGGPEDKKNLYREMCERRGISNMLFTGYVPHQNVRKYLFAADVLLMIWSRRVPWINYCSPLKLFEYMAAERVIVGHAFPTILEVLKDGEHAYLADPDSFDDLRKKTALALNESYPSPMAKKARSLVMREYTWEARAKSILSSLNA